MPPGRLPPGAVDWGCGRGEPYGGLVRSGRPREPRPLFSLVTLRRRCLYWATPFSSSDIRRGPRPPLMSGFAGILGPAETGWSSRGNGLPMPLRRGLIGGSGGGAEGLVGRLGVEAVAARLPPAAELGRLFSPGMESPWLEYGDIMGGRLVSPWSLSS